MQVRQDVRQPLLPGLDGVEILVHQVLPAVILRPDDLQHQFWLDREGDQESRWVVQAMGLRQYRDLCPFRRSVVLIGTKSEIILFDYPLDAQSFDVRHARDRFRGHFWLRIAMFSKEAVKFLHTFAFTTLRRQIAAYIFAVSCELGNFHIDFAMSPN